MLLKTPVSSLIAHETRRFMVVITAAQKRQKPGTFAPGFVVCESCLDRGAYSTRYRSHGITLVLDCGSACHLRDRRFYPADWLRFKPELLAVSPCQRAGASFGGLPSIAAADLVYRSKRALNAGSLSYRVM